MNIQTLYVFAKLNNDGEPQISASYETMSLHQFFCYDVILLKINVITRHFLKINVITNDVMIVW